MIPQKPKKQGQIYKNDNILEALGSLPGSVGHAAIEETGKIAGDIFVNIFGGPAPTSGEIRLEPATEQPVETSRAETKPAIRSELAPHINTEALAMQTRQQLESVRAELKALSASLKNLHKEIQTAIAQEPVAPGVYHVNFFEQLRSFLKVLRQKIEDSSTWLKMHNSRKKKKGYWNMYKKHGTTFGLSNERSLATSAG